MSQRILIMGLPGAGKTFLATALKKYIEDNSNIKNFPMNRAINMEHMPSRYK